MIDNPNIVGELVLVKLKGESTPCYIPFSKDSGDKPVMATEQYVDKHCLSLQEIIDNLQERVKALEGGDRPPPEPLKPEQTFTDLFKNKEKGFLYDFDYLPSLFVDAEGKINAKVGDEVHKVLDLSGNEQHLVCKGVAPKLALNETTGKHYLRFTGKESLSSEINSLGGENATTLITCVSRDFRSSKGREMYFKVKDTDFELCCYERTKYTMRVNSKVAQSVNIKDGTHDVLVGSFDLASSTVGLKVGDVWFKSQGALNAVPDKPIVIGNSGENGGNGVIGGIYAIMGVAKFWGDLSVSPIEDVLKNRSIG